MCVDSLVPGDSPGVMLGVAVSHQHNKPYCIRRLSGYAESNYS